MVHLDKSARRAGLERQFYESWETICEKPNVIGFIESRGRTIASLDKDGFVDLVEPSQAIRSLIVVGIGRRDEEVRMLARAQTFAIDGFDARPVTVEVDVRPGLPGFTIVGLADAGVREARDRVRSAVVNSGYEFPIGRSSPTSRRGMCARSVRGSISRWPVRYWRPAASCRRSALSVLMPATWRKRCRCAPVALSVTAPPREDVGGQSIISPAFRSWE